ncbi:cysteine-rich CWC family protein [Vibrio sp. TH_r3]|uniref:cysteine-rich CWC family protein n=1 Tax=Vibrio sp. TH_r3 TaxID=3082084 RepID=UPI00295471DE|nr:cysteine-rich CWC family protein [Vibrio sp. TH_r3]MDV7103138.1 cysteine-rich CWC family protein [Vibrio sp. TH_r3]
MNDDQICPFCKKGNNCMVSDPSACWCNVTMIPVQLQQLVPLELQRKSCICANCVASYIEDPVTFEQQYLNNQ